MGSLNQNPEEAFVEVILDRFVHAVPCSTDFHWLKRMNRVGTLKD